MLPTGDRLVCHVCGSSEATAVVDFDRLRTLTSDVRPWHAQSTLLTCPRCSITTKLVDSEYLAQVGEVYATYDLFELSGGSDQEKMGTGGFSTRSHQIIAGLKASGLIGRTGDLLDFGCGRGAFLQAFAQLVPDWTLTGSDQTEVNREEIERIPGACYTSSPLTEMESSFDLISMVHVLEHIPNPLAVLADLTARLSPRGLLLIQVPHLMQSPFDVAIFDHCSHFNPAGLCGLLDMASFEVLSVTTDWVSKEISVVARPSGPAGAFVEQQSTGTEEVVRWLLRVSQDLRSMRDVDRPLGVLGTTNAALWADLETDGRLDFFVDESPARQGKDFFRRPVLTTSQIPEGALVYVPFVKHLALPLVERLKTLGVDARHPDELSPLREPQ